ncbi:MAG: LysM peptidoglycan-binding domain-containing protein [Anaerolineae bacterium]|nr:LysM peptidoglycan-binding domain-containing protein [Anaerolineae bacterium]
MSTKRFFQLFLLAAFAVSSLGFAGEVQAYYTCGTSYTVSPGNTLSQIAQTCGTTVAALKLANPDLGQYIYTGQILVLPGAYWDNGNDTATYVVMRGDTLKSLATRFNTSMDAIAQLSGITNYNLIYEGQRIIVPTSMIVTPPPVTPVPVGGTYTVQKGDTLRKIATRIGVTVNDILAMNPQITNPSLIFVGQVINLPASASYYTVQSGDTMKKIAAKFNTTLEALIALNPNIADYNKIYVGQSIRIR